MVTDLIDENNLLEQYVDISVESNPIYPPEKKYRIRFRFTPSYPVEVPWIQFVSSSPTSVTDPTVVYFDIPVHPHIYSNGHICLDLLGDGWTPVHSMSSVALSLQSMLAGNTING